MNKTILYHGSNQNFDKVDLAKSKDKRDFGQGFYTTTICKQAEAWAKNMLLRHGGEGAYVYQFVLEYESKYLNVKTFTELDIEWLDFIQENRLNGGIQHNYDIVRGPVANDNTLRTINGYFSGFYSAEEAIKRLKYFQANDQVSLHTRKALEFLNLDERWLLDG